MNYFATARILVVDDEPDVLEAYRNVFADLVCSPSDEVESLAVELFGTIPSAPHRPMTVAAIDLCRQGEEAVQRFKDAQSADIQYPVAFIDMRMPPGIDGLATAKRLQEMSPDTSIVVVTGYSDHRPPQIASELGNTDRFFYLVKPFNPDELLQLTVTLVNRWKSERDAAAALSERERKARELERQVDQLRLRVAANDRSYGFDLSDASDLGTSPSRLEHLPPDVLDAAFKEGRAVSGLPHGLSLCPYSALKEAELFSAWVAGYRSGDVQDFLRLSALAPRSSEKK